MRRLSVVVLCLLAACGGGGGNDEPPLVTGPTTTRVTVPTAQLQAQASAVVDQLVARKYDDVVSHFNAELLLAMSADSLKTAWEQLEPEYGAYKSRGATATASAAAGEGLVAFDTPLTFAKGRLACHIAFDVDGKVAELRLLAASSS